MDTELVGGLRANRTDILTTREAGRLRRSDADQLDFATSVGRVIYTGNVGDYRRLHNSGVAHAGIIVKTNQRMRIDAQIRALLNITASLDSDQMRNSFHFIGDWLRANG